MSFFFRFIFLLESKLIFKLIDNDANSETNQKPAKFVIM